MFECSGQATRPQEVVPWSEYEPDGLLADLIDASRAEPARAHPDDQAAQILERIGGWERVIA